VESRRLLIDHVSPVPRRPRGSLTSGGISDPYRCSPPFLCACRSLRNKGIALGDARSHPVGNNLDIARSPGARESAAGERPDYRYASALFRTSPPTADGCDSPNQFLEDRNAFANATPCSLPEIFCLWAGEPHDLMRRNTKDLAGLIPPR
jgi:hypothetical protein